LGLHYARTLYRLLFLCWAQRLFSDKNIRGLRRRRPLHPLHCIFNGCFGRVLQRLDLHRTPRCHLGGRSGVCLLFHVRGGHSHDRHLFRQAQLVAGQALWLHHPGRYVRLLFQQRSLALAHGIDCRAVLHLLFGCSAAGLGRFVQRHLRRARSRWAQCSWPSSSGFTLSPGA
jgi:hypothetical protein